MATRKQNKYAGYRYKITTPEELREAKWLIEQGDFKDMDDYIDSLTRAEIRYMKSLDAAKKVRKAA
jgi:hypothetical protein